MSVKYSKPRWKYSRWNGNHMFQKVHKTFYKFVEIGKNKTQSSNWDWRRRKTQNECKMHISYFIYENPGSYHLRVIIRLFSKTWNIDRHTTDHLATRAGKVGQLETFFVFFQPSENMGKKPYFSCAPRPNPKRGSDATRRQKMQMHRRAGRPAARRSRAPPPNLGSWVRFSCENPHLHAFATQKSIWHIVKDEKHHHMQ